MDLRQLDTITWTLTANGEYTARPGYLMQFEGTVWSATHQKVWKQWTAPQCKFFIWLLLQQRIWTANRLQLRGWENCYFCQMCERNLETPYHLFVECLESREIWSRIAAWVGQQSLNPLNWNRDHNLEEWFLSLSVGAPNSSGVATLVMMTIWSILKERKLQSLQPAFPDTPTHHHHHTGRSLPMDISRSQEPQEDYAAHNKFHKSSSCSLKPTGVIVPFYLPCF